MIQPSMLPLATVQECSPDEANELLVAWNHQMGPILRPVYGSQGYYVLLHEHSPIAVAVHSPLICEHVGGGARSHVA